MPTTNNILLPETWTLVITGPTIEASTISATGKSIQIAIATSLPAESLTGFKINPHDSYIVTLETGENLYAQSYSGTVSIVLNS